MKNKKIVLLVCFGVSLIFFVLGWVLPSVSRWMYLPGLLGYAGCTAMLGLIDLGKKQKIMGIIWLVIAVMAAVLGIVQAAVTTLVFRFNPLFFIVILLLSLLLGWEEKPKKPKDDQPNEE